MVLVHDGGMGGEGGFTYNAFMASRPKQEALRQAMDIIYTHWEEKLEVGGQSGVPCTRPGVLFWAVNDIRV